MNIELYLLIFALKFGETSIFSAKNAFLITGEIKKAALLTFFEVIFWGLGTGSVILTVFSDYYVLIPLLLGSITGVFAGMTIQDKLSNSDTVLLGVVGQNEIEKVLLELKNKQYGATVLDSEDFDKVIVIATKKNKIHELKKTIKNISSNVTFITNAASETVGMKYF